MCLCVWLCLTHFLPSVSFWAGRSWCLETLHLITLGEKWDIIKTLFYDHITPLYHSVGLLWYSASRHKSMQFQSQHRDVNWCCPLLENPLTAAYDSPPDMPDVSVNGKRQALEMHVTQDQDTGAFGECVSLCAFACVCVWCVCAWLCVWSPAVGGDLV